MKVSRKKSDKWNYPCFGKVKHSGLVVFFTDDMIGTCINEGKTAHAVSGNQSRSWYMPDFTPTANPFEEEKFEPITIVLETKEEAEHIYEVMSNSFLISSEDYYKLKAAIKSW